MTPSGGMWLDGLGHLWSPSTLQSRSITPENPTGEKGRAAMADPLPGSPARELGRGWKARPSVTIAPQQELELAAIDGPGIVQSIWFGGAIVHREAILRVYWDGQETPSVECPVPDFFAIPWAEQDVDSPFAGPLTVVNSLPVSVNPNRGLNCFWQMPFARSCRITLENRSPTRERETCYQVNYALGELPAAIDYFHASFRRSNPVDGTFVHTILDGVRGSGRYVGTSMGVGVHADGWWGEGEVKFFLDGDRDFPTLCATGTEDYFGGAYDWEVDGRYVTYSTPFLGMPYITATDGGYRSQHRHAMYRWHVPDPIHFARDIRVTVQSLGWRSGRRYMPQRHEIASVAYWYQSLPTASLAPLAGRDELEIV